MAKIYERLLSTNILREKSRESFDPQRENLLGEDSVMAPYCQDKSFISLGKVGRFRIAMLRVSFTT